MADLRAEHERNNSVTVANGNTDGVGDTMATGSVNGITDVYLTRVWAGDRRLSLFSYTIETINLLLLPMIQTK
jgi:glutamate synthase (NADPH/NADH)